MDKAIADEARPCPFCYGRNLELYDAGEEVAVICESCNTVGPDGRTPEEALLRWNTIEGENEKRCLLCGNLLFPAPTVEPWIGWGNDGIHYKCLDHIYSARLGRAIGEGVAAGLTDLPKSKYEAAHMALMTWEQAEPHVRRIEQLVQDNQRFFSDPPAGTLALEVAADYLEAVVNPERELIFISSEGEKFYG